MGVGIKGKGSGYNGSPQQSTYPTTVSFLPGPQVSNRRDFEVWYDCVFGFETFGTLCKSRCELNLLIVHPMIFRLTCSMISRRGCITGSRRSVVDDIEIRVRPPRRFVVG